MVTGSGFGAFSLPQNLGMGQKARHRNKPHLERNHEAPSGMDARERPKF
jgi:hypothetical protein